MKEKKEEMKKRLWEWGRALEKLWWKEKELEKQKKYGDAIRELGGRAPNDPIEKEYQERIAELQREMGELLQEKVRMDSHIKGLTFEEQEYIRLRFEKGYGFDYIGIKMYRSRATLFRMQNRILEKLLEMEEKIETP